MGVIMRMSLVTAFLVCASVLVGCGQAPVQNSSEESESKSDNIAADKGPFHSLTGWQSAVQFYVESEVPEQVFEASLAAAASWNDAVGDEVLVFQGVIESTRGSTLYSSLDDTATVIYFEDKWLETTSKPSSTLATTVWENDQASDRIIRGDIILNAEIYEFIDSSIEADETKEIDKPVVDSETVILHELGHLLGLDHVLEESDPFSVMHARTFIGPNMHNRAPSQDDQFNIQSLYK